MLLGGRRLSLSDMLDEGDDSSSVVDRWRAGTDGVANDDENANGSCSELEYRPAGDVRFRSCRGSKRGEEGAGENGELACAAAEWLDREGEVAG